MKFKYTAMDASGKEHEGTINALDEKGANEYLKKQKLFPTSLSECCGKGCCDSGPARVTAAHDKAVHPVPTTGNFPRPGQYPEFELGEPPPFSVKDPELADTARLLKDLISVRTNDKALETALKVLELAITQDALAEGPITIQMVQQSRKRVMEALMPMVTLENPGYSTGTAKDE